MKHKIVKDPNGFIAYCENDGCVAYVEGAAVKDMNQEELDKFFDDNNCPLDHKIIRIMTSEPDAKG